ncbi:gliding motility lipoprotein GldH [Fulvivirgaceae bacterium BMA10]|uniref:Gliding motility lipoprotein GldH n=1 Tax=Splendidivirga corallicola TaxID=3051826 RepID=A0ABT8KY31_9BACT|nr:gliding motility lipoprotein GldH [Fulvivirgaceae bacterium BMA10]
MKFSPTPILILIFCVLILNACDSSRVFEQNTDLENGYWPKNDVKAFDFEIKDETEAYNIYYNIRNSISYPYHNLYLTYSIEDSLGNNISQALQNMNLFDPKTGEPVGSGLGDIFDIQILALKDFKFKHPGKYTFRMQQFMRMDTLPDILAVGMRIERATQKN